MLARDALEMTVKMMTNDEVDADGVLKSMMEDPEFSPMFEGVEEEEARYSIANKHVNKWVAKHGYVKRPDADAGNDPTETQGGLPSALPSTSPARQAAAQIVFERNRNAFSFYEQRTEITTILADRAYPGEWMGKVKDLPPKDDLKEVIKKYEGMKKAAEGALDASGIQMAPGQKFIPNNEQLRILAELLRAQKQANRTGGKEVALPVWYDFDNDAAFTSIMETLKAKSPRFAPYIPPKDAISEGRNKQPAWRPNIKGYTITYPRSLNSSEETATKHLSKEELIAWVATKAGGAISAPVSKLHCELRAAKKKRGMPRDTAATKVTTLLKVYPNPSSSEAAPTVFLRTPSEDKLAKMACRSKEFFFVVSVKDNGTFTVSKTRVPLIWQEAPMFLYQNEGYREVFEAASKRKRNQSVRSRIDAFQMATQYAIERADDPVALANSEELARLVRDIADVQKEEEKVAEEQLSF